MAQTSSGFCTISTPFSAFFKGLTFVRSTALPECLFLIIFFSIFLFSPPLVALDDTCTVPLGCTGNIGGAGFCGLAEDSVETGQGCNGLANCQTPQISGFQVEVEPLPVSLDEVPRFKVRLVGTVTAPFNASARFDNPNGQLQLRWTEHGSGAPRISTCSNSITDRGQVFIEKTLTCADMRGLRNNDGQNPHPLRYSLVASTCGPPCRPDEPGCFTNECHRWTEQQDIIFTVPDDVLSQYCAKTFCDEGDGCQGKTCTVTPGGGGPPPPGPPSFSGGGGAPPPADPPADPSPPDSLTSPATELATDKTTADKAEDRRPLGRSWSHPFFQRLIPRENEQHLWMVTAEGTHREFWDLDGDGIYEKVQPSDFKGRLERHAPYWELYGLDGSRTTFQPDGQWLDSRDRTRKTTRGHYAQGQLVRVDLTDGQRLDLGYHPDGRLASMTQVGIDGVTSRQWLYTWQGLDLASIERPDGSRWLLRYDDPLNPGYLTRMTLRGTDGLERIERAWQWDAYGNVTATWRGTATPEDPDAVDLTRYTYTDPWNPTQVTRTDGLGVQSVVAWQRDGGSNRALILSTSGDCPSCGLGPNVQMQYDDAANPLLPTRHVDGRDTVTLFAYDANGQMISRTEAFATPLERTTTWQYDALYPALTKMIERPSTGGSGVRRTEWLRDDFGNATERHEEGVENGSAFTYITATAYNHAGQPTGINPPGFYNTDITHFEYDPARGDRVAIKRSDPLIGDTLFEYDPLNRRIATVDPNGQRAESTFDAMSRVLTVTENGTSAAEDLITQRLYNSLGDLLRVTFPLGNHIDYAYDHAGRVTSVSRHGTDGPVERTVYTLDAVGHRIAEAQQRWDGAAWQTDSSTQFVYTTRCHLDKVIEGDGSVREMAYDCEGDLVAEWDANHPSSGQQVVPSTTQTYDALGRLVQIAQPWGGAGGGTVQVQYGYDVQDHLTQVVDGNGTVTTYTYSDRDLMTRETSEVSGVTTYAYDVRGQLASETDARGVEVRRHYDSLDRLRMVDYPGNELDIWQDFEDPAVPFSKGRLTAIRRHGESVEYRYDRFGRPLKDGALAYAYDKNGNRIETTYPSGLRATMTYDGADRPATLTIEDGDPATSQAIVTGASYLASGPLSGLTLDNGLAEQRSYDTSYDPTSIQVPGRLHWSYRTDATGNITDIADLLTPEQSRTYAYQDYQYYLTQGSGPWGDLSWAYDRLGNRLQELRDGVTTDYLYRTNAAGNASPKLEATVIDTAEPETTRYFFDAVGSMTHQRASSEQTEYEYDAAKRMSTIRHDAANRGPTVTQLRYDGRSFLDQSEKTWLPFPNERWTTQPVYDSSGVLHSREIHRPRTARQPRNAPSVEGHNDILYFAGRPVAQVSVRRSQVPGGDEEVTREVLFLTTDHLGTPVLATGTDGAVVWGGGFEPFGADYAEAEEAGVFLRFPGQWDDGSWEMDGAGPYYNVHRWYLVSRSQYSRVDPLGLRGDLHAFVYAQSNPVLLLDSLGLFTIDPKCGCSGASDGAEGFPLERIKLEIDTICSRLEVMITNPTLRKCLKKSCQKGKVECKPCNSKDGRATPLGENAHRSIGNFKFINRRATLCVNGLPSAPRPLAFGKIVLHEWAHGCKWDHFDGMGVPGDNGEISITN